MLGMLGPSPVFLVLLSFFRRYYCQWTTQQPDDPFFYFSFLSFVAVFVQETAQQQDDPFFYFSFRSFVAVVVKETNAAATIYDITFCNYDIGWITCAYTNVCTGSCTYIYKLYGILLNRPRWGLKQSNRADNRRWLKNAWCGQPQSFAKFTSKRQMNQSKTCFWARKLQCSEKESFWLRKHTEFKKSMKNQLKKAKFRNFLLSFKARTYN